MVRALLICSPAGLDQFSIESMALLEHLLSAETDAELLTAAMKQLQDRIDLEHVDTSPQKRPTR